VISSCFLGSKSELQLIIFDVVIPQSIINLRIFELLLHFLAPFMHYGFSDSVFLELDQEVKEEVFGS